ncbi:hypothetical protein N7470_002330 [Penicillium chermesinum]|nr:hypothetical protein N7470_002330 [Penicillium chermesinum]
MKTSSSIGVFALLCLRRAWASSFPIPPATPAANGALPPAVPQATIGPDIRKHGLKGRGGYYTDSDGSVYQSGASATGNDDSNGSTVTSWVPASACGYVNGIMDDYSSIYCHSSNQCVFHTPDSSFPGMVGCCEQDDPARCAFVTTCYEREEIDATPALTNYPTYMFAVYCTNPSSTLCRTWTYPELSLTDYGCLDSRVHQTVYLAATSLAGPSAGSDTYPTVAAVSASFVDGDFLRAYVSGSVPSSTGSPGRVTSAVSSSSEAEATSPAASSPAPGNSSPKSSPTNVGAIAGGVVGGVLGIAGIVAAGVMFYLLQKKKRETAASTGASRSIGGEGPASPPMQQTRISAFTTTPSQGQGSSHQSYAEVDGYDAGQKFPSQAEGPAPVYTLYEMDAGRTAEYTIAELPSPDLPPPSYR